MKPYKNNIPQKHTKKRIPTDSTHGTESIGKTEKHSTHTVSNIQPSFFKTGGNAEEGHIRKTGKCIQFPEIFERKGYCRVFCHSIYSRHTFFSGITEEKTPTHTRPTESGKKNIHLD